MTETRESRFSLASVGGSAAILMGATFVVQAIGIIRELYLAARIGVSPSYDALIIGIALPTTLAGILTAGTRTALVPSYMDSRAARGMKEARHLAGAVLVWVAIGGLLMSLFLTTFANQLVAVTGPGLSPAGRASAAEYLGLVAPVTFLLAILSVLYAVCQAERRFLLIACASIIGPVVTLIVMLLLWNEMNLNALAVGTLVGPVATTAVLLVFMARGHILPRPGLAQRRLGLRAFGRHALPLTISAAVLQLNPIIDRALASIIAPGAVSALRYGDSILKAPIGAISPAFSAAVYPALVQSTREDGGSGLGAATERTLRFIVSLFVPLAVLAAAVAPTAVTVVYARGAFDAADVAIVARVLAAFSPLIVILVSDEALTAALNARRSGRLLLMAGISNVILNAIFDVLFGLSFGVVGIALSSSVTVGIVVLWKARNLSLRESGFRVRPIVRSLALAIAAAIPSGIVIGWICWVVYKPSDSLTGLVALGLFGILGLTGYVLMASRLGLDEPRSVVDFAIGRVTARRKRRGSTT